MIVDDDFIISNINKILLKADTQWVSINDILFLNQHYDKYTSLTQESPNESILIKEQLVNGLKSMKILPKSAKNWREDGMKWKKRKTKINSSTSLGTMECQSKLKYNNEILGRIIYFQEEDSIEKKNILKKRCFDLEDSKYYFIQYLFEVKLENIKNERKEEKINLESISIQKIHPIQVEPSKEVLILLRNSITNYKEFNPIIEINDKTNSSINGVFINNLTISIHIPNSFAEGYYYIKLILHHIFNSSLSMICLSNECINVKYSIYNYNQYKNNSISYHSNISLFNEKIKNTAKKEKGVSVIFTLTNSKIIQNILDLLLELKKYLIFFGIEIEKSSCNISNILNNKNNFIDNNTLLSIDTLPFIMKYESYLNENNNDNSSYLTDYNILQFLKFFYIKMKEINKDITIFLLKHDLLGYSLVHYLVSINYTHSFEYILSLDNNYINILSIDSISLYETAAGRWNMISLQKLSSISNDEIQIDILRNSLEYAIETSIYYKNKDLEVLYYLLKQLKIEFTLKNDSEKIIETIENTTEDENTSIFKKKEKIEYIQNYIKTWLRRMKYKDLKKSTMKLQNKLKNYLQRKRFMNMKDKVKIIQKAYRDWRKEKS